MGKRASKSVTLSRGTWSLSPEGEVYCCATEVRPAPIIGRITAVRIGKSTRYEALTALGVPITDGEGCVGDTYADKSAASNAVFYREHPGWDDLPCTWSVQHDMPCGSQMDTYYLITRLPREDAERLAERLRFVYRDTSVRAKPNTADRECHHDVATPQA